MIQFQLALELCAAMVSTEERASHLLLLPPPPLPATWDALTAAYRPPITSALRMLASEIRKAAIGTILDIALPMPHLVGSQALPRSALYEETQNLVSGLYKLACVIAAKENINVEDYEGVDVRVLMLAYKKGNDETAGSTNSLDPVISLQTLANCQRNWDYVIAVESEEGEEILRQFSVCQDDRFKIKRVTGGTVLVVREPAQNQANEGSEPGRSHTSVVLGGTFDHIHIGHKLLLTMFAFILVGEESAGDTTRSLTIGITGDELLTEKKYPDLLESWDQRQNIVLALLRAIMDFRPDADAQVQKTHLSEAGPNGHAIHAWLGKSLVIKCVQISDPYGPTITDEGLSAIVISAETRSGAKAVNDKRKEKGWAELEVFEVDVLDAEDSTENQHQDATFQAKLSSTTIRKALSERAQMRSKV